MKAAAQHASKLSSSLSSPWVSHKVFHAIQNLFPARTPAASILTVNVFVVPITHTTLHGKPFPCLMDKRRSGKDSE